jgi:hypothetical protein
MSTFYRGDIVADEDGTKYRVIEFSEDDMVDLYMIDGGDDEEENVVEAKVDVLHLVSRPVSVTLREFFKYMLIPGDK